MLIVYATTVEYEKAKAHLQRLHKPLEEYDRHPLVRDSLVRLLQVSSALVDLRSGFTLEDCEDLRVASMDCDRHNLLVVVPLRAGFREKVSLADLSFTSKLGQLADFVYHLTPNWDAHCLKGRW